jgi:ABC-type multidrug transport system permease subunit
MNKIIHYRQLKHLIIAYFKEIIREPAVLFWGIIFPILMSLGLGIAFTQKSDIERTVAVLMPEHPENSDLLEMLEEKASRISGDALPDPEYRAIMKDNELGNTTLIFRIMSWDDAMRALKRGTLGVVIEENKSGIRYHFDPSNADAQLTYMKITEWIEQEPAENHVSNGSIKPLTLTGTRYIDFLIPGLITMGVMTSCLWGLGYNVIDKRAKKLMRRMVATPMKKSHFLFSLITVRIMMNFIESGLLLLFAWLVFDVTIQGNIIALLGIFLAGNLAFSGLAVFIASRTANTEIGNGLINTIVFPMMVLSGIFFSYHNFPDWSIPFIKILPLTMFTDAIRSIFIEGAGFSMMIIPFIIMSVFGFVFFVSALKIFKWY